MTHTIASGETLSGIARKYKLTLAELLELNPGIEDPDQVEVGQDVNVLAPEPEPEPVPEPKPQPKQENLLQRVKLTVLYPAFAAKLGPLVEACRARGVNYWAISGERTWAEQSALYNQGRKTPGKIVTNARAGYSSHNFAVAADFCADESMVRSGLQPDWDPDSYKILAEEAAKLGLESGLHWKFMDAPHIQLPLARRGITMTMLREAYTSGGKVAVFHLLDQYRW